VIIGVGTFAWWGAYIATGAGVRRTDGIVSRERGIVSDGIVSRDRGIVSDGIVSRDRGIVSDGIVSHGKGGFSLNGGE
jgi:hypothetical protein